MICGLYRVLQPWTPKGRAALRAENERLEEEDIHEMNAHRERWLQEHPPETFDTSKRVHFNKKGATVHGWPSSGGMIYKRVSASELVYLGLDRLQGSVRSLDHTEEDAFSERLLKLGAVWRKDEMMHQHEHFSYRCEVAWPTTGGVWVLKIDFPDPPSSIEELEDLVPVKYPDEFGKLQMAFTMDERATILEGLGATFDSDPSQSTYLMGWINGMKQRQEKNIALKKDVE
jgi:hypothetical protein